MKHIDRDDTYWKERYEIERSEVEVLEQQLSRYQGGVEVGRLKAEVDNIKQVEFPRRVEKLRTDIRKQTAQEILQLLDNADWACSTYEETYYQAVCAIKSKFGLEG